MNWGKYGFETSLRAFTRNMEMCFRFETDCFTASIVFSMLASLGYEMAISKKRDFCCYIIAEYNI